MTECAIYRANGRELVDGDISDALDEALRKDDNAFCWIDLHEPTAEEFELAAKELELHPLAVEDALSPHQRPKLERYGKVVLVVLKALTYDPDTRDVESGEVLVFLGRNYVVTVRHGDIDPLGPVRHRLDGDPELLEFGAPVVLYGVLDAIVDEYVEIADQVQDAVTELEERVFLSLKGTLASEIYALKREVLQMHNAIQPLVPVMNAIVAGDTVRVTAGAMPFFRDVADHVMQVNGKVASINELLPQVMSAYLAQVSVQQNDDGRRITAWAAIMAVPTMVAGVYGMNFTHMPELKSVWGYPSAMIFIAGACIALFVGFKRSKWL
ncbi:magnesium transporter [Murinocardiopsis flavida]|uniref:Magnesium transport protein CorA n=1 Tax=Murinocardiopsis flavida TaxID=645275 RepID=A0A2P8DUA6_9ACTN|nr:magnesium/cobalt transporter CorA [Murinocardiopsis flavida]PSL00801.1 magnesium transporter [Murinocardiopsis flavida]